MVKPIHRGSLTLQAGISLLHELGRILPLYESLEAGGKPSTRFPPEGLVKLPSFTEV